MNLKEEAEKFAKVLKEEYELIWKMPKDGVEDRIKIATTGLKAYNKLMNKAINKCPNLVNEIGKTILVLHKLTR